MTDPRESISLFKDRALLGKGRSPHIDKEYEILEDKLEGDIRTIILKERDLKPYWNKVQKLVDIIADKMGEGESKAFKGLLFDALKDFEEKHFEKLYKQVTEGERPVKVREGCFKLIVGDGRRGDSWHIMLRE